MLYGSGEYGGNSGNGAIYSVPVTGGTPNVLASFSGSSDGEDPMDLTLSNGILYGVASFGGPGGSGDVFSVPVTGGTPTVLAYFNGMVGLPSNGAIPIGDVILSGSSLIGATENGGRLATARFSLFRKRAERPRCWRHLMAPAQAHFPWPE